MDAKSKYPGGGLLALMIANPAQLNIQRILDGVYKPIHVIPHGGA